jgi:hypothetical protein
VDREDPGLSEVSDQVVPRNHSPIRVEVIDFRKSEEEVYEQAEAQANPEQREGSQVNLKAPKPALGNSSLPGRWAGRA